MAGVPSDVRLFFAGALLLLCGCGPGLVFNNSTEMSPDQMLARVDLVFVGVIEKHQFDSWPFFRLQAPGIDPEGAHFWKILRREVRAELVIRGVEPRKVVDVYEIFWTGATSGDWNSTQNDERDLFLVRLENGYYHVARDWWRSIFPITSGPHSRLPLDDSHSLWERIALLNWWFESGDRGTRIGRADPGLALSLWRIVELERGLMRHPNPDVRLSTCVSLLTHGWGQDECWEALSEIDRAQLGIGGSSCCSNTAVALARSRMQARDASWWWNMYTDRDTRRLLTAVSNRRMRAEFCRLYAREYPGDQNNGCPADQPPPATIVTQQGDVPLVGAWPQ